MAFCCFSRGASSGGAHSHSVSPALPRGHFGGSGRFGFMAQKHLRKAGPGARKGCGEAGRGPRRLRFGGGRGASHACKPLRPRGRGLWWPHLAACGLPGRLSAGRLGRPTASCVLPSANLPPDPTCLPRRRSRPLRHPRRSASPISLPASPTRRAQHTGRARAGGISSAPELTSRSPGTAHRRSAGQLRSAPAQGLPEQFCASSRAAGSLLFAAFTTVAIQRLLRLYARPPRSRGGVTPCSLSAFASLASFLRGCTLSFLNSSEIGRRKAAYFPTLLKRTNH